MERSANSMHAEEGMVHSALVGTCPQCGARLKETYHPTKNYGGGWDTMVKCTNENCDYAEVYV